MYQVACIITVGVMLSVPWLYLLNALLRRTGTASRRRRRRLWERLLHLGLVTSWLVSAGTGLGVGTGMTSGKMVEATLRGSWLLAHMAAGAVFAISLSLMVLAWPDGYRPGDRPRSRTVWSVLLFWGMTATGFASVASMTLSMFPLFGTDGMRVLGDIHRYAGIPLTLAVVLHGCWASAEEPVDGIVAPGAAALLAEPVGTSLKEDK